ncbi:MAG: ATP-binding protein [Deltaproteobacteria bacterium]|jgi:hypothetical protein|nr:ATP-binding protein [Deltaproteobacteria bacterium]
MIDGKYYFVLHAPRQSGKTTCLRALTHQINSEGKYFAVTCSLATLRGAKDEDAAMRKIVSQMNIGLRSSRADELRNLAYKFNEMKYMADPDGRVRLIINDICEDLDRELIVFFDEADCIDEDPLITFLAQIRDGYLFRSNSHGTRFPRSLALVGMRDIRDYLHRVRPEGESTGLASPFNVKKESLTLADFTVEEIGSLYGQHTAETGQAFMPEAVDRAWYWTGGQPWLVNALADNVVVKQFKNDYSRAVTGTDIDQAVQDLILRNPTHFDSLAERLKEPRVRRVMEAVIVGAPSFPKGVLPGDVLYARDLGLLKADSAKGNVWNPSNPVYREIIARAMMDSQPLRESLPDDLTSRWTDGKSLDMNGLLKSFQKYWRENRQAMAEDNAVETFVYDSVDRALVSYKLADKKDIHEKIVEKIIENITGLANEAFAHIVLFAFLQRVLNGGADFIAREYGLGRTRVDICVGYKGSSYPLELKIRGAANRKNSIDQLLGYMDKCG